MSFLKNIGSMLSGIAPVAGSLIGGLVGGPGGAMLGNTLGGIGGNLLGKLTGGGSHHPAPQQQGAPNAGGVPAMSSPFGGGSTGERANNFIQTMANKYMPQSMQQSGFGQAFGNLAQHYGDRFLPQMPQQNPNEQQQPFNLGQSIQGLSNQYLPQSMQQSGFGQAFGNLANSMANRYFPQQFPEPNQLPGPLNNQGRMSPNPYSYA